MMFSDNKHGASADATVSAASPSDTVSNVAAEQRLPSITEIDAHTERRLLLKIDVILMPILMLCYMLQFLDKSSLSYASIMGISKDTGLHGDQFSWVNSIFYFGYLIFSYPTSLLLVKFPIGKYVSTTVLVWAGFVMLHAACHNYSGLLAVRFFLGAAEATVAPAFALLVGSFYKRSEQPLRQCIWFVGNALAGVFGSLAALSISKWQDTPLETWKYFFLIFGACTGFWAIVMFIFLPDDPSTAWFLSSEERILAAERLQTSASKQVRVLKMSQIIECFMDPQVWLLFCYTFCINIGNGGLSSFGALIVKGFGYSTTRTYVMQIPVACSQIFWILLGAIMTNYIKNSRIFIMIFFVIISVIGAAMMFGISHSEPGKRLAGFCLTVAYVANLPLSFSLVTSNVAGFTKKSTTLAMIFVAYCVGNIAGPQFFKSSESPNYPTGLKAGVGSFAVAALMLLFLRFYLGFENRQRLKVLAEHDIHDIPTAAPGIQDDEEVVMDDDITDRENKGFIYLL